MRFVSLIVVLAIAVASACAPTGSTSPSATRTPSPVPTVTATATPSPTPTPAASSTPAASISPSPIALPSFAQISAPNANVVWVLVAASRLFLSNDRGDSWQERSVPTPVTAVAFASDLDGWAMFAGSPATQCQSQTIRLWHTSDGAHTWAALSPTGIPDAQCKEALSFVNVRSGFISAWDQNHSPAILQTIDGGRTWSGTTLTDPPGFTTRPGGFALRPGPVRSVGTSMFVEATGGSAGYVFVRQAGEPSWSYLATLPPGEGAFAFAGARWLILGPPGGSQESTDGGQTWHPFSTDYRQAAPISPVVTFADANVGYATVRGAIQRTTDGGAHWTSIKTPGTE